MGAAVEKPLGRKLSNRILAGGEVRKQVRAVGRRRGFGEYLSVVSQQLHDGTGDRFKQSIVDIPAISIGRRQVNASCQTRRLEFTKIIVGTTRAPKKGDLSDLVTRVLRRARRLAIHGTGTVLAVFP